jgi:hypothetical protein
LQFLFVPFILQRPQPLGTQGGAPLSLGVRACLGVRATPPAFYFLFSFSFLPYSSLYTTAQRKAAVPTHGRPEKEEMKVTPPRALSPAHAFPRG